MNIKEKITKILDETSLMRIATISLEGMPKVRSVDFARDLEDESKIYFMTFKNTNKVKELSSNNNVHIVVDKEANSIEELAQVLYLKASGQAFLVETQEEAQKAMGFIMKKYPYLANLPGDPSMMAFYRVDLKNVFVTDNNVQFGHTEELSY
ncbi:hypothetical protein SH2C18_23690 [Clostridium sediminicola]|uniref:pyridoxamine 5'-phosphate oxidase family protein n=1 Tax=Clostridium sediminicola TaxID=3114879 RepID=UPI0031F25529